MSDIEIPDNEDAACALDDCIPSMAREGSYHWVEACRSAARRLRADAEEIARLHEQINRDTECIREVQAELNRVYELRDDLRVQLETARTEAAAQRELATLLERESTDPLTRIAAARDDATGWLRREIENHNTSRESAYVSCRLSDLRRVIAHIDRIESEPPAPLTRIAAALERPSREWVAALVMAARVGSSLGHDRETPDGWNTMHVDHAGKSTSAADALLAEVGEK